ncbi:unnamed protein product [Rotaria socialis]|uniref:B30.2/SPRY domain-containing protein n=1 Tax=Rotaria socialis TaxID=392032 RepID=A0A817MVE4_9BILA|nr:unnamed protein product [Rotaria socialis]
MTTERNYRTVGDIKIKNKESANQINKKKVDISYGRAETNFNDIAIVQLQKPLTCDAPYFVVDVHRCDPNTIISIGIAPLDIDAHAGQFSNSLGYQNNSGRIYTSWKIHANTLALRYGKGSTVSIYVTYFGEHLSTVLIFYNNFPIATRYHFEGNKTRYLPTITFSGGPAYVSVLWPDAVEYLPSITDISVSQWIRGPLGSYNPDTNLFENRSKVEDLPIQSPIPLSKSFRYFIITQEEVSSTDGKGASVGLATCSPLKPTPTCSLLKDYYTWFSKTKMKVGNTIGWGVFYDENCKNDKAEQLCLVFVMFNKSIVDALFVLQPEGGFFPIVLLQPYASKVSIERHDILTTEELNKLQGLYAQMVRPAMEIYRKDTEERYLSEKLFRKSEQILLSIDNYKCRVSLPKTENSIHYIQFCKPLTYERRFFFVELENITKNCQVTVGIASAKHKFNEAPGTVQNTVGYNSYSGKLYANRKDTGNMRGHKCYKGDTMGVQIEAFGKEMSVALFSRNFQPLGTRYLTLNDHSQYFPTILIENNGDPVDLLVHWQTRVSVPPQFSMTNPEDWCLPEAASIDLKQKMFILPEHFDKSLCIQAPCSLNKKNRHFEMVLLEKFTDNEPPPAIALCTASPADPPSKSQFRQDYLRFWPTGDAARYLKQGDKIGWGIIFPQEEDSLIGENKEQLIICYLSVNRAVGYVRVLYQPVGGFYPVVIAPPNINLIQMDFSATQILTEEFTTEQINAILADARLQIEAEEQFLNNPESADPDSSNDAQTMPQYPYDMNSTVPYNYQYPYDMTTAVSSNYQYPYPYPYDASSAAYSNYQYPSNTSATVPTNNYTAPPQNQSVKSSTCIIA